ncbi:MAG: hypothetical protein ACI9VR_005226 [Cognaticolwellia sp.]
MAGAALSLPLRVDGLNQLQATLHQDPGATRLDQYNRQPSSVQYVQEHTLIATRCLQNDPLRRQLHGVIHQSLQPLWGLLVFGLPTAVAAGYVHSRF